MIFQDPKDGLLSVAVVKFIDHLRFTIDGDSISTEVRTRYNALEGPAVFKVNAEFLDSVSCERSTEHVLVMFKGFFRDNVEGRILPPPGVKAKEFDKYKKGRPYMLTFSIETFEQFTPTRS